MSEPGLPVLGPVGASTATYGACRPGRDRLGQGTIKTEVVVIGTGAGGAIAGVELARAGKKVLFLESGGAYDKAHFQKRSLTWSVQHLYDEAGVRLSLGEPPILLVGGRAVGGSTVINSAIAFRPPAARLREWAALAGAPHLEPEVMAPLVDEVWRRIGVFKMHAGIGRKHNVLFGQGVDNLGWDGDWFDRNAPACLGCGVCHLGCPSGGKASVDKSLLPEALHLGAEVLHSVRVEEITVEGGRARGVVGVALDEAREPMGRLKVEADLVIVSGSAIGTPVLLTANGLGGPRAGKGLCIQPAGAAIAEWSEPVNMWDGVPQGYYSHDPDEERVIYETQTLGMPEMFAVLGEPGNTDALTRMNHYSVAGALTRDFGQGSVEVGAGFRPSISYDLQPDSIEVIKTGLRGMVRIFFAAGAKRVWPLVHPRRFYEREADALRAIDHVRVATDFAHVHSSHPLASCRMGPAEGPNAGVVDGWGKVHGTEGLYVLDGSILPGASGVNPQVTIMSIVLALSRRLAA